MPVIVQTSTRTRAVIRGRSPRKGETVYQLVDRAEDALRRLGYDSTQATVWAVANSPRSNAVEISVTLTADGYDGTAVKAAASILIGNLPADLRFELRSWSPA